MSTPNVAEVLREQGASFAGFQETLREIESVKLVRFAWHPWMPLPNLGADTFRFNVRYAELPRLEPIALTTVQVPDIQSRARNSMSFIGVSTFRGDGQTLDGDSSGFGGSIAGGRGAVVKVRQQTPEDSLKDLLQAWTHIGMTPLLSLDAVDERELEPAFIIYEAVMGVARSEKELEAGRRPTDLLLEDFPNWLSRGAGRALEHALRHGVERLIDTPAGKTLKYYKVPRIAEQKGVQLIEEVRSGIARAENTAISPENGILFKTRKLIQVAKNGGGEGKHHYDGQDMWLMAQYPNFDMDTDTERASRVLQDTLEGGQADTAGTNAAILAVFQQMAEQGKRQDKILEMLAKQRGGKQSQP